VAHRVFMGELTRQHVADDLHIPVSVRAKSGACLYAVFVDHAQGSEFDVFRIEIVGKRKGVEGLEPAVVGIAPLLTASDLFHGDLLWRSTIRSSNRIKKRKMSLLMIDKFDEKSRRRGDLRLPRTSIEQWAVLAAVVDHGGFAQAATALNRS